MYLSEAITARAATDTGARDPDSLLGCLIFAEAGGTEKNLAKLIKARSVGDLLEKARAGTAGRVEAFKGDEYLRQATEYPEGVLPLLWKRELVRLLLRANGALTSEILRLGAEHNIGVLGEHAGNMVRIVRDDLRPAKVGIEADKIAGANAYRFKIVGDDAWRLQKIIANGWAL